MSQFGRSDAEIADFLEKMCRRSQLAEYQVGSLKALLQEKSAKEAKNHGIIDEIMDSDDTVSNGLEVAKRLISNN